MELKVQKSFNIVLQLDENEATQVASMLVHAVDFTTVPLARELYDALSEALDNTSPETSFRLSYDEDVELFLHRGGK